MVKDNWYDMYQYIIYINVMQNVYTIGLIYVTQRLYEWK